MALLLPPKRPNVLQTRSRFCELADQWRCGLQIQVSKLPRRSQIIVLNEVNRHEQYWQKDRGVLCDSNDQRNSNK